MAKTILVTGSSRGIGKAIAQQLAKDGFDIVLHCVNSVDSAKAIAAEIETSGRNARVLQFDVADRAATRAAIEADLEQHGPYYGVVLNAGITRDKPFPKIKDEDWDDVISTNLDGFYNVIQPCVMPMVRARNGGRIVTLSSISGTNGNRGQVNYSASKAGLVGATKSLSLELAKRDITVNCVAPGFIETDMTDAASLDALLATIPANRPGQPQEVADLISFLCSEKAAYITRQVISINGGLA